jgi:hypothetical protein
MLVIPCILSYSIFFRRNQQNAVIEIQLNRSRQTCRQVPTTVDVCVRSPGSINSYRSVTVATHHCVVVLLGLCGHVLLVIYNFEFLHFFKTFNF